MQKHIYWEKQGQDQLCGVHCINSLLQGPFYSEIDLAQIAQDLDKVERQLMGESEVNNFQNKSNNVAEDGNFSIQVLSEAIKKLGNLQIESVDSSLNQKQDLSNEQGFICNSQSHWFAIRKVAGIWYNLNSTNRGGPEIISDFYLSAFLLSVRENGYHIFVVKGEYPDTQFFLAQDMRPHQKFYTQVQVQTAHQKRLKKKNYKLNIGGSDEAAYQKAIKASLGQKVAENSDYSDDDMDNQFEEEQPQKQVPQFQGQGTSLKNGNLESNYPKFQIRRQDDPELFEVIMITLTQTYTNPLDDGIIIQFMMPNNQKEQWTFRYDATVEDLYDFVYFKTQTNPYQFILSAPYQKMDLLNVYDQILALEIDSMTQIIVTKY